MPIAIRSRSPFAPTETRRLPFALTLTAAISAFAIAAPAQESQPTESTAAKLAQDRAGGAASVAVADCKAWLGKLASAEFAGRGTGQEGYRKAANYVAAHFRALGLEARGDDGTYFQKVPWSQTAVTRAELSFTKDGQELLTVPAQRMTGRASTSAKANGSVLLLQFDAPKGSGRSLPTIEGLDEIDFEGKVVVAVIRGERRQQAMSRFSLTRALQGESAAALVFASTAEVSGGVTGGSNMRRRRNPAAAAAGRRPPELSIGGDDLTKLLGFANLTSETLAEAPLATTVPVDAGIVIETKTEDAPAMNVWAVLPGSDPQLKDEYVVIGSHLDHLGERRGTFYPGADDDGSGTTGVMAAAQMFAKNEMRPKRSILFVCFSGEERGLVGSRHFVKNCPVPLASIAAELQMDMIGRSEEEARDGRKLVNKGETADDNRNVLHMVGTKKMSMALHDLCMAKNETANFELEWDSEGLFTRSDHANFAYAGVPIAFFFTGIHKDYHQATDTPDKIEYPKLLRVARFVYDIGFEVANSDARPTIDEELWSAFRKSSRRVVEEPAAPMTPEK